MDILTAKTVVKRLIEAGEPVLLIGHAGVGKTSLIYQIAEETGRKVYTTILSQMEPGDLIGIPVSNNGKTHFTRPEWMPPEDEDGSILFLDELNRAPVFVRQAILQLVQEQRIGPHRLPKCSIVAAANPDTNEYIVSDMNDRALVTRFVVLALHNSASALASYLTSRGYDGEKILAAVGALEQMGIFEESVKLPKINPNPRSFERAIRVLSIIEDQPRHVQLEVLSGVLGSEGAAEFVRRLTTNILAPEDLLSGNAEKVMNAPAIEKLLIMLRLIKEGIAHNVPKKILDLYTDEDWAAVFRNMAPNPKEYAKGFAQLKKVYPRVVSIYSR